MPASRGSPVNLRRPRKRLPSKVKRSCTASDEGGHPVQLYRGHNTTRRRLCTCVCVQKKRKCGILVVRLLGGGCSLCVKVCGRDRQGEGARWLGTACARAATCFSADACATYHVALKVRGDVGFPRHWDQPNRDGMQQQQKHFLICGESRFSRVES